MVTFQTNIVVANNQEAILQLPAYIRPGQYRVKLTFETEKPVETTWKWFESLADEPKLKLLFDETERQHYPYLVGGADFYFDGAVDILDFLAAAPTPQDIIALRPTPKFQAQVEELLEKKQTVGFSDQKEIAWQQYECLEHLVRLAKSYAYLKLKTSGTV